MCHEAYLKIIQNCIKSNPLTILGVISSFSENLVRQHIYRHHYMIKLIKLTTKYIKWAYTTDRYNLIFGIPLLQEWWRWHCYSHPNYICLNIHQTTFDYSTWEAYISKTKNDRNKWISHSESWHLGGYIWWKKGSHCTNNIPAKRDV